MGVAVARADVIAATINNSSVHFNGGGTHYIIQKNGATSTFYLFFIDSGVDLQYSKTTDGGFTWSTPIAVFTGSIVAFANWYDRWSGISGDKIRLAYTASDHIIRYRDLDISTDTLGTETTVFTGVSTTSGGALSIVTGRNGHIRVAGSIDAGAEDGAWSSTDDGATWGDTIADPSEGATQDQYYLLPGWNADTADVMLIFVDASANGLSVKRYDDSGNAWAETAILTDGNMAEISAGVSFPHVACFVDVANSRNIVAAWNAVDAANQDIQVFIIDDTSVTETATRAVLNATDDSGLLAFGIDTVTGTWYIFYGGNADGSETFSTAIKIYYKTSTDSGATWSAQAALTAQVRGTFWLSCTPRFATDYLVGLHSDLIQDHLIVSANIPTAGGGNINLLAGKL